MEVLAWGLLGLLRQLSIGVGTIQRDVFAHGSHDVEVHTVVELILYHVPSLSEWTTPVDPFDTRKCTLGNINRGLTVLGNKFQHVCLHQPS